MKFSIVDAFTDRLFGGNPAGVVILPQGGDFPSDEVMRLTAAELRYSETAFIKILGGGEFNIRYFTPAAEVDLCGHATIASFYTLLREGIIESGKTYTNRTLAGVLSVEVGEDFIFMDMAEGEMHGVIDGKEEIEELYRIMGIEAEGQGERGDGGEYLIPKKVSTGLIDIMLPVKDEKVLESIEPDFPTLAELSERLGVVGVHAFTVNTKDGKIHARNFAPLYDIDEEAATGTSNGALIYYLYDYGLIRSGEAVSVVQGEKMGRPSEIAVRLDIVEGREKIKVGGFGATLAEGRINI